MTQPTAPRRRTARARLFDAIAQGGRIREELQAEAEISSWRFGGLKDSLRDGLTLQRRSHRLDRGPTESQYITCTRRVTLDGTVRYEYDLGETVAEVGGYHRARSRTLRTALTRLLAMLDGWATRNPSVDLRSVRRYLVNAIEELEAIDNRL